MKKQIYFSLCLLLLGCDNDKANDGNGLVNNDEEQDTSDTDTPDTDTPDTDTGNSDTGNQTAYEQRVVAYFTEWGVYERNYNVWDIPAEKLTHINYGFVSPMKELCTDGVDNDLNDGWQTPLTDCQDPDCGDHIACGGTLEDKDIPYQCQIFDAWASVDMPASEPNWPNGTFAQLQQLKSQHPHLKTLISIGGWTLSGSFSELSSTESSRNAFVSSCVQFIQDHGFDGIDVDWEYPVSGGLDAGAPEDKANYTLLLSEFRNQLDAINTDYLLTIAAPGGDTVIDNMDLNGMTPVLDWINLMSYDFNGSWSSETDFNAALFASSPGSTTNVDHAVQRYLTGGVPANKLVLGFPFYGRGFGGVLSTNQGVFQGFSTVPMGTWEQGIFDYHDLVSQYINHGDFVRTFNEDAKVPSIYSPSQGILISYDDPESFEYKVDYIKSQSLGGAMFWELSGDTSDSELLNVLYSGLISQ